MHSTPAVEIITALEGVPPGDALDLACGAGRNAIWLRNRGWHVTAVDQIELSIEGVTCIQADLERGEFVIAPNAWDLIVCWLYWQEDLLPAIAAGLRPGGIAALAGKTSGRFETSLANYRRAFEGWEEIASGEPDGRGFWIGRKSGSA
ncbi:MAG TPA: methyltransferase domain-containing protein [Bryobacteraceae bacterium]|nr:methyltransferase domain-containing protein [Bryobacteraceae bacterium]